MIYFEDDEIRIRDFVQSDAAIITQEEIAQGWNTTIEKYEKRLKDQAEGRSHPDMEIRSISQLVYTADMEVPRGCM